MRGAACAIINGTKDFSVLAFNVNGVNGRMVVAGAQFVQSMMQAMMRKFQGSSQPRVSRFVGLGSERVHIGDRSLDLCKDRHCIRGGKDGHSAYFDIYRTGVRRNVGLASGDTAPNAQRDPR